MMKVIIVVIATGFFGQNLTQPLLFIERIEFQAHMESTLTRIGQNIHTAIEPKPVLSGLTGPFVLDTSLPERSII